MRIQADLKQVNGEVKERNRLQKALYEIRKIVMVNCDQDIPLEMKEQSNKITQICDDAFKSTMKTTKRSSSTR